MVPYRPECLTPPAGGVWWVCGSLFTDMVLAHIEGPVTANRFKIVLSDQLCSMIKHFNPDAGPSNRNPQNTKAPCNHFAAHTGSRTALSLPQTLLMVLLLFSTFLC